MRPYFELVTSTSTDTDRLRLFGIADAEEAFAETNLRNQPSLRGDDPWVTIEFWRHGRDGATRLRRAWWCVTGQLRYQWDGSDQVDLYDEAGESDETPVALDAFALRGERPETPEQLLQACLEWERSHPERVDHIQVRQTFMQAYHSSAYSIAGAGQAGGSESHDISAHQAAKAAGILEELASLLRTPEPATVDDYHARIKGALEALEQVSLQARVLRATTGMPRHERV